MSHEPPLVSASQASVLCLLRTLPVVVGITIVALLFAPAYLTHEPRDSHEENNSESGNCRLLFRSGSCTRSRSRDHYVARNRPAHG